jgi:D-alanine--poly(phosphoribitol) ligase subunit 1
MQRNVIEYLEKTVEQFPNRIAVEDENGSVSFKELKQNALAISGYLLEHGMQPCQPVAVFMPKSIKAVEAFIGILYAGGFYVPLDTGNPRKRIHAILNNINPKFILSEVKYWHTLDGFYNLGSLFDLNEALLCNNKQNNYSNNIDTDPAYLINTSGSTGTPKGVLINHRSIIDYIDWAKETYHIDENHIIGNQAPFVFDNSVLDIYLMLATGSKLDLIPEKLFMFPLKLIEYLEKKEINFIFWVPSIMSNVLKFDALKNNSCSNIKHVLFAGEVMPAKVLNYWKKNIPTAIFSNLYGPTEITVDCTYYIFDRNFKNTEDLPIGFPCDNTCILILNDENQLVTEVNVLGELCVRGSSLAMGYYNDLNKTEQAFVQNPLNTHYPEKIYRTGDIVYFNKRGELMYKGRKDFQIKHMGYRIELGEIETSVLALDGVNNACVLYDSDNKDIVLIYESNSGLLQKDILIALHGQLPKYMLPNRFELVEILPLNLNGKIDRNKVMDEFINV